MTVYLGIDPGLRHTGLASWSGGRGVGLHQINTKGDVLSSLRQIRTEFGEWARSNVSYNEVVVWGFERQLPTASVNGWLLTAVQLALWDEVWRICQDDAREVIMVAPYPGQLTAYERKALKVDVSTDRRIREAAAEMIGLVKPPTIHKSDAYFAARMARDVFKGDYAYEQKPVKPGICPWAIQYGSTH